MVNKGRFRLVVFYSDFNSVHVHGGDLRAFLFTSFGVEDWEGSLRFNLFYLILQHCCAGAEVAGAVAAWKGKPAKHGEAERERERIVNSSFATA